jgi:putative spermidine/putrescine transport system permease protein
VLLRSFLIGGAVGLLVVVLAFPLSYFLVRTTSRWKNELVALCFAPLLASVIVRTYGWHTILHRDGIVNEALLWIGVISEPLLLTPSTGAIIVGLTHVLLPYGVLTIMSSLQGINPNLESAAMNLGASRFKTFFRVVLPLSIPGVAGGFFLAFAITLSAYATPAILGGPRQETMATMIYAFMNDMLDWSMSSTIGMILVITAMALMFMAAAFGNRRGAL